MKRIGLIMFVALLAVGLVALYETPAMAKVQGVCNDCHTMHNSQDGSPEAFEGTGVGWDGSGGLGGGSAATTPNDKLLKTGCLGCHTGLTADTLGGSSNNVPLVYNTMDPTTDILAGGNFYWCRGTGGDDTTGHNVPGISAADATLTTPPGYDSGREDSKGDTPGGGTWSGQVSCAGTNGCHGTHDTTSEAASVAGGHHGDDSIIDGTTVVKSYRFLIGILGLEDSDWEYQATATAHNEYKGKERADDTIANSDKDTISWLCGECHGQFHSGATAGNVGGPLSPFVRHPTDYELPNKTEYAAYTSYSTEAPVARVTIPATASSTVTPGSDIVMCISCHRAHGSDQPDLLRWDYGDMDAGSGVDTGGCFTCHTTKDDS